MNTHDREQLALWVEKLRDDSLSADEFDQLQRMLNEQLESRELYLDLMHQAAHLQLERLHFSAPAPERASAADEPAVTRASSSRRGVWLPALAAMAAALLLIAWRGFPFTDRPGVDKEPSIAKIVESSDAQWGDCSLPTLIGSDLSSGRLKLERGLATIRFDSGAEVTLESPAELELQSPMQGRLLSGTAVVEVPESAHGFVLSTRNAVAIDHGTAFSVSIDRVTNASSIEVLEGEVEVQHVGSDAALRLKEKQRVVASALGLGDSGASSGEAALSGLDPSSGGDANLNRITTANGDGRDSSVGRSQAEEVRRNSRDELVLIKNPFLGFEQFSRKGYFAFDLRSLGGKVIDSARFVLTLQPSGLGFASKVDDCEFIVYGLTDESGDNWTASSLTWQIAPGNADHPADVDPERTQELGRFVVERGRQHGQVSIEGEELVNFLNEDTNRTVTLIVVRATKESDPGGLVHGFANGSNSVAAPPSLLIHTGAPPDQP